MGGSKIRLVGAHCVRETRRFRRANSSGRQSHLCGWSDHRRICQTIGVRQETADFWGDLGGAGGQAAKEFQRAGYVGPQLGLFYEIASGGAVKGQNFLGARAEAALALVVSLGGGHAAKG